MIFSHPSAYMYMSRPKPSSKPVAATSSRTPAPGVGGSDGATWTPYLANKDKTLSRVSYLKRYAKEDSHPYQNIYLTNPHKSLTASRSSLSLASSETSPTTPSSGPGTLVKE
ncbi:hypothetical protein BG006_005668 [Podila minutissima]|uniref:Uncharacterized protein n=1 Tax=Podila minutissima TaxID=64525 RepID=A0A9P5VQR1_9FUNG|nr:hypothetical protein BG006_005668 [Podila minutissima]